MSPPSSPLHNKQRSSPPRTPLYIGKGKGKGKGKSSAEKKERERLDLYKHYLAELKLKGITAAMLSQEM